MLFRQYPQVLLTSFLIVGLTDRASIAFNIIPPNPGATMFYRPESTYQIDKNRESKTEIDMGLWSEPLPHGGTPIFKNALSLWSSFKSEQGRSGWSFNAAAEDLKGSFEVITYQACSPKDECGGASTHYSDINESYRAVGSLFHLKYHPGKGDPQPGEGKLHWIQMVQANYGSNVAGASLIHGVPFIDNFNRKENPYYDRPNSRFAGEDFLMDQPYNPSLKRASASRNNYFKAQLYLVQETTPPKSKKRTITIYNGIKWGWKNTVTRRKEPVPVPVPVPAPTPDPIPFPFIIPEWLRPKTQPFASSASGGGGIGYVAVSPSPIPRPIPSPTPRPILSPTPLPTPSPTPSPTPWTSTPWTSTPWTSTPWTSTPWTSTPWTSTPWTSTPWTSSPLGSTSSTVVVSTSTTITSPSPFPKPSSPAPSPRPAPATSSGGRPIQAAPLSAISKGNAANLRSSSLFQSSSKANTDYLTAFSADLLQDSELSSTSSNLNNAKVAGVSRDLLEDSELLSTDSNQNQVNLADISSDLLEDSELSSTNNNENQVNLAGISSDLLEDPELSSTENDENNADIGSISADLLQDQELSSEDNNENQVDLADISADLLEDPELSYVDDTLIATTQNVSSKNTDDDALSAEAVPEPTTALGTLLALAVLPVIKKFTNRKTKE